MILYTREQIDTAARELPALFAHLDARETAYWAQDPDEYGDRPETCQADAANAMALAPTVAGMIAQVVVGSRTEVRDGAGLVVYGRTPEAVVHLRPTSIRCDGVRLLDESHTQIAETLAACAMLASVEGII